MNEKKVWVLHFLDVDEGEMAVNVFSNPEAAARAYEVLRSDGWGIDDLDITCETIFDRFDE